MRVVLYVLLYLLFFFAGFALKDGVPVCDATVYNNYYGLCP